MSPTDTLTELDELRSMDVDGPAGPLFSSEFTEADISSRDPYLNCSLSTGSQTINCCA